MHGGHARNEGNPPSGGHRSATASRNPQAPHLQAKLQQHIDREDQRIKTLTESILFRFLPDALKTIAGDSQDPIATLTKEQATAVAGAALCLATLLNAPPGFLEFLLCLPWSDLPKLWESCGQILACRDEKSGTLEGDAGETPLLLATPSQEDRAVLVNAKLDSTLLDWVMDFLYQPSYAESLPPLLALGAGQHYVEKNGAAAGAMQRAVRAELEGCTALHCAAARGNPALVDALLHSGADPLIRNSMGELPIEMVPKCGDTGSNRRTMCRCMGHNDQEAWECRSRLARLFLVRRCISNFSAGVWAWLQVCVLCLLCLLGVWGCPTTLLRADVEERAKTVWEERKKRAEQSAQAKLLKLKSAAAKGREELETWADGGGGGGSGEKSSLDRRENDENVNLVLKERDHVGAVDNAKNIGDLNLSSSSNLGRGGGRSHHSRSGTDGPAARAFVQFSAAVKMLQSTIISFIGAQCAVVPIPESNFVPRESWTDISLQFDEVGAIWAGYSEAALAKLESCGCTGCAAVASASINSGVKELLHLINEQTAALQHGTNASAAEKSSMMQRLYDQLATVVHAKARLLLKTDVQLSPTRSAIWRAQQCVAEWSQVNRQGAKSNLHGSGGSATADQSGDPLEVQCLQSWAASAAADVMLVEALLGSSLPLLQPLAAAVPTAVQYDVTSGGPRLNRPVTKALLQQLEATLTAARPHASDHIVAVAEGVAKAAADEIAAGDRLRELLLQRPSGGAGVGPTSEQLAAAVDAAARFPSLKEEIEQVEAMRERWAQRTAIQQRLDEAIEKARAEPPSGLVIAPSAASNQPPNVNAEAFYLEVQSRIDLLEAAVEEARLASLSVAKAKKTIKDLQSQRAAIEAAAALDESLAQGRSGSASLKAALSRAENAVTAATGGVGAFSMGSEVLSPRVAAARSKLALERAAEALARAVPSCRGVSDLPKLEAAILAARKVGAHELDPAAYAAAKELRANLDAALKARTALETAVRILQRQNRPEDVVEAEKAISAAEEFGELLTADVIAAREAVQAVQAASAAELKLAKALREGAGVTALSLAIKDAAATGVKVTEARRILKLMQNLEVAVSAAISDGPAARQSLQGKIAAAAAGGVPSSMIAEARMTLHRLLLTDVRAELDAALRTTRGGDNRPPAQRLSTLRAVLEKVDAVLALEEEDHQYLHRLQQDKPAAGESSEEAHRPERSTSNASAETNGSFEGGHGAATPPLVRDSNLRSQGSFTSQPASSTAGSAVSTPTWSHSLRNGLLDHHFASHAAGHNLSELTHLGDCEAIELRMCVISDVVAVWFEAVIEDEELLEDGAAAMEESGFGQSDRHAVDAMSDDAAAVRRMARQARLRLEREERQQARLDREKAEESRLRRELQAREKAVREAADKERAEKARAERAERIAALEAQKAERRERERALRAERERQRQEREEAAREHFVLLQRQRKLLDQQARAAQLAKLLAEQQAQQTAGLYPMSQGSLDVSSLAGAAAAVALASTGAGMVSAPVSTSSSALSHHAPVSTSWDLDTAQSEPLSSDAISTLDTVLKHLDEPVLGSGGTSAAEEVPSLGLTRDLTAAVPAIAGTAGLTGSSSAIWSSTDGLSDLYSVGGGGGVGGNLATGANATETTGSGHSLSLFGDLGGASWLSTNPATFSSAAPGRTLTAATSLPSSSGRASGLAPSSLLWGSADLASSDGSVLPGHHLRDSMVPMPGFDNSTGLWSSTGSAGDTTTIPGGGFPTHSIPHSAIGSLGGPSLLQQSTRAPAQERTMTSLTGSSLPMLGGQMHTSFHGSNTNSPAPTAPLPGFASTHQSLDGEHSHQPSPSRPPIGSQDGAAFWAQDAEDGPEHFRLPSETSLFSDFLGDPPAQHQSSNGDGGDAHQKHTFT